MLIINESSVCAFLLTALCLIYIVITFTYHLFYCTCWVPTISVLNLAISPSYSNLLLRRRRWIGIPRRGVWGYVLPQLPLLWCYGVFRYFILLRVILVFKDFIYVIMYTLYSWHLVIYEHSCPYVWNNWFWVMHMMSTQFWHKTSYDKYPGARRCRLWLTNTKMIGSLQQRTTGEPHAPYHKKAPPLCALGQRMGTAYLEN
jgi:hypothetical protein